MSRYSDFFSTLFSQFTGSIKLAGGTYQVAGDRLLFNGTRDNQPIALTLKRDNWGRMRYL